MPALKCALDQAFARLELSPHPERAQLDAETLLLHVLGKNKAWLLAHREEEISPDRAARYDTLVERRYAGEPIQYITGQQEFYGLLLHVSPAVLIPRPETELLVETILHLLPEDARIVDVGTGSGAIAIALAVHLPNAEITALDISPEALTIAATNASEHNVSDRIHLHPSNLLSALRPNEASVWSCQGFDAIVSNPPYIPESDRASLHPQVREHEPAAALFAGSDGLDLYRRLIPQAYAVLKPNGLLALEIGHGQREALAALLQTWREVSFIDDLQQIPRVVLARKSTEPSQNS